MLDYFRKVAIANSYNDDIGNVCRSDSAIVLFGSKMLETSKVKTR